MARRADITAADQWFTGEDRRFVFTIDTGDGVTPENLTGWALSWMVKRRLHDADTSALITKTTAAGGIVLTNPATGVCTVTVADTDTVTLAPGRYHHELKRVDDTLELVIAYGLATLQRSVHKT